MTDPRRFVVLSIPRTGSSYLTSALRRHPRVLCHGEIFHEIVDWHIFGPARRTLDLAMREGDPAGFVEAVYAAHGGAEAVGFKIFMGHSDRGLAHVLGDARIAKIVLHRPNLLASYSSLGLAKASGIWNQDVPAEGDDLTVFCARRFADYRRYVERTYALYRDAAGPQIELHYPGFVPDGVAAVLAFLGFPDEPAPTGDTVKLRPGAILDRFSNRDEVKAHLAAEGLSHWAEE